MNDYNTIPYDPDILHRLRHHDKVPAAIRELDNISNIIRQNMSQAADEIENLRKENADLAKEHNYYVAALGRGAKTNDIWPFYQKEQIRNNEIKESLRKAILAQVKAEFPDNKELIAFWDVDNDQK